MAAPDRVIQAAVPAGLRFSKMHGAGNDFVVLDLRDGQPTPDAALCRLLADRHRGVGCDQILGVLPPRSAGAVAAYGIWNADGTASQQCGNGARCVAAWLVRDGAAAGDFVLDSPLATHAVRELDDGRFEVAMGAPVFTPAAIPLLGVEAEADAYAMEVAGETLQLGAVSMGNPHAVIEVGDLASAPVERLGPALQQHAAFPQQCNVGFATVLDHGRIRLRVHERGVGETLACGSGACAAVAVLARRGRVDALAGVDVELPGGTLRIQQDADGVLHMAGPAAFVYEGTFNA
ncbi:MAG TPA: diaminopimelate epimerase [Luteimonas sp.]